MGFSTTLFIDKYHPKADGKCAVSVRVTIDRKKRYYPTGETLSIEQFSEALSSTPKKLKDTGSRLRSFEDKAHKILTSMQVTTFSLFERDYLRDRAAKDSVGVACKEYAEKLMEQARVSTASLYQCAANSLTTFKKDVRFVEIDPDFLKRYEAWMLSEGNSVTTIGIYLRNLRFLFNERIVTGEISAERYPFGRGKYQIPTSKTSKRSLKLTDIENIYNYQVEEGSNRHFAKDIWLFSYLCNGMNLKDVCRLKYENIQGEFLIFFRAKTERTKKVKESIKVFLLPEAVAIIERWGNSNMERENYIFPFLKKGNTPTEVRKIVQNLTKLINSHFKAIGTELDIQLNITTYVARHSQASIKMRAGTSIEAISEDLGHADIRTTKSYLAGFEDEAIKERALSVTSFKKTK